MIVLIHPHIAAAERGASAKCAREQIRVFYGAAPLVGVATEGFYSDLEEESQPADQLKLRGRKH